MLEVWGDVPHRPATDYESKAPWGAALAGGTNYTHHKGEHPTCPKEHQTPHTEQHVNNYYKATLHATGAVV
jgi:hypothetical protein